MSQRLINSYLADLDRIRKVSGSLTEGVISEAFKDLLKSWAKSDNLIFINQYPMQSSLKKPIRPDGAILHDVRVPLGYWEAKDTDDDLDAEIKAKLLTGYPQDNIIFEDSRVAVLWQDRNEITRCDMTDTAGLEQLLSLFFSYERPEIAQFRQAVEQFKTDLPAVLTALREKIDDAYKSNTTFKSAAKKFLAHACETINPTLGRDDVREMLIQHILTEEIFARVFDEADFHRDNNVAKLLYELEGAFFTGAVKKSTLKALQPYYTAINANAAQITSHTEKQTFLKVIYENFYKVYNPDAADRLGVVYTPNEIVRFMIEGADWLTDKHFGKRLIDEGVEILDPATGTGTYICELIEYFRGQPDKLRHKYTEELHANEVAILPYYVANLNIEATYQAVAGQYAEYPNLCFVDTLDNIGGLGIKSGHQFDMFASVSDENVARVKRQNKRKISVVIGNPPYNAQQKNENDNNKNRTYPHIDSLIKRSFVKLSSAQKTTAYDMYARFFRWASDRLHDDGVIAFVTNRSFIDSRTFDGFRRYVAEEFDEIYLVDLGGDVRANPKLSGIKNNVFGIQTGVAISFFVRRQLGKKKKRDCKIHYVRRDEMETAEDKLSWLSDVAASDAKYDVVTPDEKANWINQTENDWDDLLPVADKKTKAAKVKSQERSVFKDFSTGMMTGRDEWVYDFTDKDVVRKGRHFAANLKAALKLSEDETAQIKLSRNLKRRAKNTKHERIAGFKTALFRPYSKKAFLMSRLLVDEWGLFRSYFEQPNVAIGFLSVHSNNQVSALATDKPFDYGLLKNGNGGTQSLYRHRYTPEGDKLDNITDWALNKFTAHYGNKSKITKDDIFAYVYAVLHDPIYRETYAINLKREFPRIPFYEGFHQWRDWGQRLLDLHIGYETVKPLKLRRTDVEDIKAAKAGLPPKPSLKADKDVGTIRLDSETTLSGIPPECWEYKLGNRSGLEWVLDQYKEKTPRDPTIREKFNTYRFADYKEDVVKLLGRVARVSVETMEVTEAMRSIER
ncbi:N-6 DNA methylase [Sulfitobacter mediterraneus]|uniref:type ISP restriction/modification enzyme n=1 Tax=Sulfitobacter mediterraneus TaxID=83219 RepID=UPI00193AB111|nr:type ISP restriction/modification enzyme [Sulfitobacter mediterraneus]MBM1557974.1 N-6 DNA methylase [Sulfitobacter mediterraneus]MBM1569598.1 N-6 DNA methylase [Sulfitobacter mediterraneus]MBM1573179.1 N-6 DNA methylase [Sulfitobacter mediterraneus]MBM1577205.1 N-6 DNA methylase [Sulfitobacter mediterraneus]MBM1580964.1 N-6 DNA methylase [Sulfitobacter mediterraneus]